MHSRDWYLELERNGENASGKRRTNKKGQSWFEILEQNAAVGRTRPSPVWKYLHSMVFVASTAGQVDKAPLRVFGLLLRRGKRRRNEDFHSDAISRELTLRRGRRGTEAYRIIGLLAISVKTCESAAKGEVQSHYVRTKRYKRLYCRIHIIWCRCKEEQ